MALDAGRGKCVADAALLRPDPTSMSTRKDAVGAPRSKGTTFVRGALLAVALLCFAHVLFGMRLHQSRATKIVPAVLGLLILGGQALRAERRTELAVAVVPTALMLHVFAFYITSGRPAPATAAARAGRTWDARSKAEIVADLRGAGVRAYPSVMPKLLGSYLARAETNPLAVDGASLFPLGGIASVTTVYCNEGGEWSIYEADEHGFNNPKGLWGAPSIDVAVVGDSYVHGACVRPEQTLPSRIREKHPATLNLGMGGNGPLQQLASIREYLAPVKPHNVVWAYFRNDLDDLAYFKDTPLLRRYVDDPAFRQGVFERQPQIDEALKALVDRMFEDAASWPRPLGSMGLTRTSTPVWLQDIVMGEYASSASEVIRLDFLRGGKGVQRPTESPDFELFERVLLRAKGDVAAWGGQLHVLFLPDLMGRGRTAHDRSRDRVIELVKKLGLPIIDAQAAFDARSVTDLTFNTESHCNPAGYEVIGALVNEALPPPR
jgi:hypothetical protein